MFERLSPLLPIYEIRIGHDGVVLHLIFTTPGHDEALCVGIRQRPKQNYIDDAEDRRVRADAQRQCDDGNGREARSLQEISCSVTNITEKRIHNHTLVKISSCRSTGLNYSYRSATIGSTFVARRAGTKQATSATIVSSAAVTPNVSGSLGCTPKSMLFRVPKYLVNTQAPARPSATPIKVKVMPCRRTIASIRPRFAPKAMRIPISCVRRDTE